MLTSLELLLRPEVKELASRGRRRPTGQCSTAPSSRLTMPLTTGPGPSRSRSRWGRSGRTPGSAACASTRESVAAAALVGVVIWVVYWSADRFARLLSTTTQRIISRLSAFLLLCIGVQIMIYGVGGVALVIEAALRHAQNGAGP